MRPLNWKAPADYIKAFLEDGEIFCNTSLTNLQIQKLPFEIFYGKESKTIKPKIVLVSDFYTLH